MPIPGLPYDVTQPGLSPLMQAGAGATSLLTPYKRKYGRGDETTGAPVPGPPSDLSPAQQWQLLQGGAAAVLSPYEEKFGRAQADAPAAPSPGVPAAATPAPGLPAPASAASSPADEAQWGGAGTQKQAGGYAAASGTTPWEGAGTQKFKPQEDLPQPLAHPKPAGISAEAQQVLDAQDQKRQGALLGDIQKFQGYQKANLAAAEGQASGQGGPPLPMLPALDTIGSGDTGGNFPDVANQYRGLELLHSMGVPGTSQAASDAYAREKNADKQKGFQDRRSKLLEESTGTLSPLQQQDLRRRYNQVGLEESQAPDMPPALHINTQAGDQPGRYAMPSAARSRFVTPGTPEFEEAQRAGTARSALAQALHDTPAWLKLEEARMHVQAQQELAHNTMVERAAASTLDKSPEEQAAAIQSQVNAKKYAADLRQPGVGGPAQPPGLTSEQATKKFVDAQNKNTTTLQGSPDEKERQRLQNETENAYTLEALHKALGGNNVAMRHAPTRAMIAKAIQSQGGKRLPNMGKEIENAILAYALEGGALPTKGGTANVAGIKLTNEPGFWSNKYTIESPWRGRELEASTLPWGHTAMGISASSMPTWKQGTMSEYRGKAEFYGELLKLLHEHGAIDR